MVEQTATMMHGYMMWRSSMNECQELRARLSNRDYAKIREKIYVGTREVESSSVNRSILSRESPLRISSKQTTQRARPIPLLMGIHSVS